MGLKGGFYPSVYGGVQNAAMLAPLAARHAYRLWSSRKTRKGGGSKRKSVRPVYTVRPVRPVYTVQRPGTRKNSMKRKRKTARKTR